MNLWIILALMGLIALAISATGFIRVVYFVSIGYAYSVAAMAVAVAAFLLPSMTWNAWIQLVLLAVYGVRLGTYILLREGKAHYSRELKDVQAQGAGVDAGKRVGIWIGVSVLYVAMALPSALSVLVPAGLVPTLIDQSSPAWLILTIAGLAVMALGLGLEALADHQKNAFKKARPDDFCNTGLYRFVRCPNYLGEILVWTGAFIAAIPSMGLWWLWIPVVLGWVCIVLIMMGSTKRQEAKQDRRYQDRPEYQKFIKTVPVLFPFVPVYSLKDIKVYLE